MRDMIWLCQDGRTYTVAAMAESHIRNSLAKMDRHREAGRPWREEYRARLELELDVRRLQDED